MQTSEVDVMKAKTEYDKKEFMRRVLTALANDKTTPTDIFSSTFGEVVEDFPEFLEVTADTEVNYSVDIGYDSKITGSNGVKETVTTWKPLHGSTKLLPENKNCPAKCRVRLQTCEKKQ